jgi:hypothetical protein
LHRLANEQHLKNLVNIEIINNEEELVAIKRNEYEQGNIYSNGEASYSTTSSYEVNESAGYDTHAPFKYNKNPLAGGAVDLILEGDFINSFLLIEKNKKYLFDATDWKKYRLMGQYNKGNKNIFNLHQDKFDFFINKYVKQGFIKSLKKELGQ